MNDNEHGPGLCVAMKGDYMCERFKGHDGPHSALDGEIEWSGDSEKLITDGGTVATDRCDVCQFFEAEIMDTVENAETGEKRNVTVCPECHEKMCDYRYDESVSFDTEMRLRNRQASSTGGDR